MAISACASPGVRMSTTWTSSRSSALRQLAVQSAHPILSAAALAACFVRRVADHRCPEFGPWAVGLMRAHAPPQAVQIGLLRQR
jgi:hypothetical protein